MIFFKKILYLIYSRYLLNLYSNDKKRVIAIIENFYLSLIQYNFFFESCYSSIFAIFIDNEHYFYNRIFLSNKIRSFFKSNQICRQISLFQKFK